LRSTGKTGQKRSEFYLAVAHTLAISAPCSSIFPLASDSSTPTLQALSRKNRSALSPAAVVPKKIYPLFASACAKAAWHNRAVDLSRVVLMENNRPGQPEFPPRKECGNDRRVSTLIDPPPYQTFEGLVTADRRSAVDRRATWIREFYLHPITSPES
jgi:hypothetical protein